MREKTRRHQQLEILNRRYKLSSYEKEELLKLEAGREGEMIFDGILENFIAGTNIVHLKDYNFYPEEIDSRFLTRSKEGEAHVQIDNVVLAKDFLYTFEIKNYSFDLSYKDSRWYFENGNEFSDPLVQVTKQRNMMSRLLGSFSHQIRMFNVLVFINENQTIYNLPSTNEIIVRSNLRRKLSKAMVNNHYDYSGLVADLESRHLTVLKHQGDTTVEFRNLDKGVFCVKCGDRLARVNRNRFKCGRCGIDTPILVAANQLINEIKVLNQSWTLTPSLLQLYSDGEISEAYVRANKKRKIIVL